jgi:uncharacterized membrane protein
MKIWRKTFLFYVGGMLYCGLELLWRGYTHGSMFLLGGACFLVLGKVESLRLSLFSKAVLGGLLITAGELAVGLLVNKQHQVWDYRSMPMNFRGQICPLYTLFWTFLSPIGFVVYRKIMERLPQA